MKSGIRGFFHKVLMAVALAAMVLSYQNCSPGFEASVKTESPYSRLDNSNGAGTGTEDPGSDDPGNGSAPTPAPTPKATPAATPGATPKATPGATPKATPSPTPVASVGKVPSWAAHIRLPFKNSAPKASIYVAPDGDDSAAGTMAAPLKTIQAGVNKAKGRPGTAILVRAGTYTGSLNLSGLRGTDQDPIRLVSIDGPGKARIIGTKEKAAVQASSAISYVGIYGFYVQANVSSAEGDVGGFKIWGSWTDPARNIVVAGNIIDGRGQDGFKIFGGARDMLIIGNTINGAWLQESIDNVSVEKITYAFNTLRGSAGYTGITIKTGSRDSEVVGNLIDVDAGAGMFLGGIGNSQLYRSFPKYWDTGWEAKNLHHHHNVVTTRVRGKSASFIGSNNCLLENNFLPRTVGTRENETEGVFRHVAYDNKILNNSVGSADFFQPTAGNDKGFVVQGNVVNGPKSAAGAESPEAEALMDMLGL